MRQYQNRTYRMSWIWTHALKYGTPWTSGSNLPIEWGSSSWSMTFILSLSKTKVWHNTLQRLKPKLISLLPMAPLSTLRMWSTIHSIACHIPIKVSKQPFSLTFILWVSTTFTLFAAMRRPFNWVKHRSLKSMFPPLVLQTVDSIVVEIHITLAPQAIMEDPLLVMVVDAVTQSSAKYDGKLATRHFNVGTMLVLNSIANQGPSKLISPILPTLTSCSIVEPQNISQMTPPIYKIWLLTKGWSKSLLGMVNKLLSRMKNEASCQRLIISSTFLEFIMHQYCP